MKLTKFVAFLSGGKMALLDPASLNERAVLVKSGASSFAINANDYIAVSLGKKVQLFHLDLPTSKYIPLAVGKSNEMATPDQIMKMGMN